MSAPRQWRGEELAPEQYELHALAGPSQPVTRRRFLKTIGTGLIIVAFAGKVTAQAESGATGRRATRQRRPAEIDAWIHIAEDGSVTFFTGKTEVGQNIRTVLTQIVAEELPMPLNLIRMVMADTDLVPFDAGTFGSRTTPEMGTQLRRVAATARETLLDLAASTWKVDRTTLVARDGQIQQPTTGRAAGWSELTKGQRLERVVMENPPVKAAGNWTVAGTSVPKVDGRLFVTGQHRYASDVIRPELVFGKVLRPPTFGATLTSIDTSDAEKISHVTVVRDGDFVGVTGPTHQAAQQAVEALHAEWTSKPQVGESDLFTHLKESSRFKFAARDDGTTYLRNTYEIAYIAHAPLEPRSAVAEWTDGKVTVWTGTQRPFGVRTDLAKALGVSEDNVRVIVPDTGSAYGGKHTGEAAIEAARLAKGCGRPVKLVWTREEEFTWAYFRPAGVIEVVASVREDGTIGVWDFHNYNSGNSGIRAPYRVMEARTEYHPSDSPLPQGSYRGLAATANHFARESQIDELARQAKQDPLAFRLKNLNDERARAVLEAAAKTFGWAERAASPTRGYGLAVGTEKGSFVATCAEIAIDLSTRQFRVVRVVQAFECGAVVNPAHLISQNQGSIMQGLGGALFEAIHFEGGRILNPHFAKYRVPRFADTPVIEVVLVNRPDLASVGAGETPIVTIAPAIGNAIASATGVRIARLPLGDRIPDEGT